MVEGRVTSVRVRDELLRDARILAIREGLTFRALVEELLEAAVGGDRIARSVKRRSDDDIVEEMLRLSMEGRRPLVIVHEKSAVELVREGRGE
ncbi:MAG: hypothetical protein DRN81_05955 [Thermoproteota archaeon]|nr:MAG: hypothetical protein DRN81_05955 [Candidatus Korarchaeota archaeon]